MSRAAIRTADAAKAAWDEPRRWQDSERSRIAGSKRAATRSVDSTIRVDRQEQPAVFLLGEPVGHPGQVVADHPLQAVERLPAAGTQPGGGGPTTPSAPAHRRRCFSGSSSGDSDVLGEQRLQDPLPVGRHPQHPVVPVDPLAEEPLQPGLQPPHLGGEADQRLGRGPHVRRPTGPSPPPAGGRSRRAGRSPATPAVRGRRPCGTGSRPGPGVPRGPAPRPAARTRRPARSSRVMNPRPEGVVEVVGVVGDAVHHVDDLGFEQRRRRRRGTRPPPGASARPLWRTNASRTSNVRFSPGNSRVALLQLVDPPQAVQVVVEPAVPAQALVEGRLAGVAERRVADVVGQGDGLGQVLVQPQPAGDRAGHLRDFEGVREPGAVVVVDGGDEHLRLAGHAAEGGAVDDPLAVPLVERAERVRRLRVPPPAARPARMAYGASQPSSCSSQASREGRGHGPATKAPGPA